ncbi:MAG: DUF6036 family nucleotidyltransferase [Streptococcaceae bacterium]|nr:DUF6036 family nucleotidyltransferase [Streptococcaceae bacterium]
MPLNKQAIKEIFAELNKELLTDNLFVEVILIGGSAGIFLSDKTRPTMDIDVFLKTLDNQERVTDLFLSYDIENVTVASVPDPNEMTFSDVLKWSNLIVYIPDFYSLAITKLFTTRAKDEQDLLTYILLGIEDFEKLDNLIKENSIDYVGRVDDPFLNVNRLEDYKKQLNIE